MNKIFREVVENTNLQKHSRQIARKQPRTLVAFYGTETTKEIRLTTSPLIDL